jgi:transcriptional regulator with XRE-family HTH domain
MGGPGSGRRRDPAWWRKAVDLRARGLSLPEISRRLGITHQGVRRILRRSGPAARLPAVCCAACGATAASLTADRDAGRAFCRACLSARADVPRPDRLRSLRLASGPSQRALSRQADVSVHVISGIDRGEWTNPVWPTVRALVAALGVELVPGCRLTFPPGPGQAPGAVACRECGRTIVRGTGSIRTNGAAYCLGCLARHPEASFGERLKAHRLAAGLTVEALGKRVGVPHKPVCDYERGRMVPQWRALVPLVGVLGLGLVCADPGRPH